MVSGSEGATLRNGILYAGFLLSVLCLGIAFPLAVLQGRFKPSYIFGIALWVVVGAGCLIELRKRRSK